MIERKGVSLMKHAKKSTKKQKVIRFFIPMFLIGALGFCSYQIGHKLYDYYKSDSYYSKVQDTLAEGEPVDPVTDGEEDIPIVEGAQQIDWEQFKDTDAVAWVQLDKTSYPIYHDDGSMFYLSHLPDGTYASAGSIFLYGDNSGDFTDQSSFVYGHNMLNGTMFGRLKQYAKQEYGDHYFYIYLPDGTRHKYQFFSVASVGESSKAYTWSFANEDSFLKWQQWMKDQSLISCSAPIDASKRFVTLSTCNGTIGTTKRLIICGQEVAVERVQNPASWYADYAAKLEAQKQKAVQTILERDTALQDVYVKTANDLYDSRRKEGTD